MNDEAIGERSMRVYKYTRRNIRLKQNELKTKKQCANIRGIEIKMKEKKIEQATLTTLSR